MNLALDLAWRGWGRVHPNPLVGAVVLADGIVAGEGWHAEFGDRHAEPWRWSGRREGPRRDVIVTLEPCDHRGKQPPCTDAIVRAGVRGSWPRWPIPTRRPAAVRARLGQSGLEVQVGVAGKRRRRGTRSSCIAFATSRGLRRARAGHQSRRPDRRFLRPLALDSGEPARDYVHWLRAGFDAIGVGGRTGASTIPGSPCAAP